VLLTVVSHGDGDVTIGADQSAASSRHAVARLADVIADAQEKLPANQQQEEIN